MANYLESNSAKHQLVICKLDLKNSHFEPLYERFILSVCH